MQRFSPDSTFLEQRLTQARNILTWGGVFLLVYIIVMTGIIIARKRKGKSVKNLAVAGSIVALVIFFLLIYVVNSTIEILYRI